MEAHHLLCTDSSCIFCLIKEPNLEKRQALLIKYFKRDLPSHSNAGHAFAVSGLWSLAISRPNDAELIDAGILGSMASLIRKGIQDRRWLLQQQNIFVPYYAAHIIGSYTMNREDFAERAVKEGVIPPLLELLRGRLTWVEQRVAVRALGHLASFSSTFLSVAVHSEVLELGMELAVCSLDIVYTHFVQTEEKRLQYHRELLTRRAHTSARAHDMENRKAEEWASQLQCWSLQLINCFAFKEKYIATICRPSFISKLPDMWGGLVNEDSPAGIGLLRSICQHKSGRSAITLCPSVVQALSRIARSSDDWQYLAVECLLLLLQDTRTRQRVMDMAVVALADLAELPSMTPSGSGRRLGDEIMETLLQDDTQSPCAFLRGSLSAKSRQALDDLASCCGCAKWEKHLSRHEHLAKEHISLNLKLEGNARFAAGDVRTASSKFTDALAECPVKVKKERMILYSNRAQCHLLMEDAEAAISDATRALCLARPVNCHGKSLWRRAQAYEMLGMAKESLMDAIMFANECTRMAEKGASLLNQPAVPDYAEEMVNKLMKQAWLFKEPAMKHGCISTEHHERVKTPADSDIASSVSSSLPSTATRVTMAPSKRGALRAEAPKSGSDTEPGNLSDEIAEQAHVVASAKLRHHGQQDQAKAENYTENKHAVMQHSKFTPRSRDFLHSKNHAEGRSPKRAPSPLLPTIREEIDKHLQQQAGQGRPLDTQLLKKTVYDLLHQNFSLDRSRSNSTAGDHFPLRDDSSYIAR
ncbi:hypothetical protein GOP47_0021349 [Adiantum capillus-veneris]|uniref:ARM repeat N-terminal plant domain-containing protein n=1 Tax=Adiantum capillus-veneris TaxID=13818 RepID=A0A9D4U872_ADICA|nr:hypothetical protein GOP47_0021349 [Adiantum capillus-veneris]